MLEAVTLGSLDTDGHVVRVGDICIHVALARAAGDHGGWDGGWDRWPYNCRATSRAGGWSDLRFKPLTCTYAGGRHWD